MTRPGDSRQPCPIPIGWTVCVYRSDRENGLAIYAHNEQGREFTLGTHTDSTPGAITVELPSGKRVTTTEVVQVNIGEPELLAFLWERAVDRMHECETQGVSQSRPATG